MKIDLKSTPNDSDFNNVLHYKDKIVFSRLVFGKTCFLSKKKFKTEIQSAVLLYFIKKSRLHWKVLYGSQVILIHRCRADIPPPC
jgi:hypothetical protein